MDLGACLTVFPLEKDIFSFPVSIYVDKKFNYYALPIHGIPGYKIGIDGLGEATTGDTRTFQPDVKREKLLQDFLGKFLPKVTTGQLECRPNTGHLPFRSPFIFFYGFSLCWKNKKMIIVYGVFVQIMQIMTFNFLQHAEKTINR